MNNESTGTVCFVKNVTNVSRGVKSDNRIYLKVAGTFLQSLKKSEGGIKATLIFETF